MRNQHSIILTTKPKLWKVEIDHELLYERLSQETSYLAKKNSEALSDDHIILDDDKPLIKYYRSLAISDLTSLLARRLDVNIEVEGDSNTGLTEAGNKTTYCLVVDDNMENSLQTSLQNYCFEYVVLRVMEMWYKQPQGSDMMKDSILKVLDFRRRPVRRPVRSFL